MVKNYIEWLIGGRFFAESSGEEVSVPGSLPSKMPKNAAAYRFYTRQEVVLDGETLTGNARDHTPWHYFGVEYNLAQLADMHGKNSTLYGNIAGNDYTRAVHTFAGNWYPLNDGDTVGPRP